MLLTLAWAPWLVGIFTVLFLVISIMMILTVLIQRPQGGGLAGAFGSGAGSGQTAFGTKTGDALTIFTIIVFVLFVGMSIALNYGYRPVKIDPNAPAAESTGDSSGKDKGVAPTPVGDTKSGVAPATTPPGGDQKSPPAPAPGDAPATTPSDKPPSEKPATTPADQPK